MELSNIRDFVRDIKFLSVLDDAELRQLTETAQVRSVAAGEVVFTQGDAGDAFYVVYSGRIRIVLTNETGKDTNLGIRSRGDHFGETALITDKPRNATARAVEDSTLVVFGKADFEGLLFAKPELRDYFDKFMRATSVLRFIESCTELSAVPVRELKLLVGRFKAEFFNEGDAVIRQGAAGDRFYLVESGKLKVVRWDGRRREVINFLREGDFFGEKALMEETERHADVVCLTDCRLFSLSKADFQELAAGSAKLRKVMADRIASYLHDEPPMPYEELIRQELAADKAPVVDESVPRGDTAVGPSRERQRRKRPSFRRRAMPFPFIRQRDEMSCGPTCLMTIAKYYGKTFSSARVRELAHVDMSGSSLAGVASAAEQTGFSTRGMRLDLDALGSVTMPCIAHWQGCHFVVVYKIDSRHVWVSDPAIGRRKYTREHFKKNWSGIALTCEPTPEFDEQEEDRTGFEKFLQFVVPYRAVLFEVFLASLLLNVLGLAMPIFTQNVVDNVLAHDNRPLLNVMLVGMLLVLVFRMATMLLRQYLVVHTSMQIDLRMLVFFYKHLLGLPLGYFKARKIGDFITRFGENRKIRNFLTNTALSVVLDGVLIVVYISLMFYYDPRMSGLILLFVPAFVAVTLAFTPILKRLNADSFSARAESQSHLIESIHAVDTIKATNTEFRTRWKWEEKFIRSLNLDFRLLNTAMCFHATGDFIGSLCMVLVLWYGAHRVMAGPLTVGQLMAFMSLVGSVIAPINSIIMAWDDVQQTLVSIDRLNDVFSAKPELPSGGGAGRGVSLSEARGAVTFEDVFFRYGGDDDPYILSKISLRIEPGQIVAIVGRSGSGKSTLVKLIPRLYDVTEGRVLVDGLDVRGINLGSLRRLIGHVLQESYIFNGTVRENIVLHDPGESMARLLEVARLANIDDFVSRLPMGYDTRIGESGLQLSGGQKQRVAIARALYTKPKILILDEATSSLDTESEQAIQKNMKAILKDRTAIVIAHRMSTVRNADVIVVLDNGEIVEQGSHEALMERRGLYHYLNHQQLNV